MIRLLIDELNGVSINEMQDGDVAVVVEWFGIGDSMLSGTIVQRCGDMLIPLGKPSGKAYDSIFSGSDPHDHHRVRILGPGTELVLDE